MLSGDCRVVQASGLDGLPFSPFSFQEDGLAAPEVDVGRCQIADGLVVTLMVVMIDKSVDLGLEIAGQIVILEQDAVLQCLVPAFDLALGLGVEGSATDMLDAVVLEPFRQIAGDVRGTVVAQQTWPMATWALSQPDAVSASSRVSVTSSTFIVVHSFQEMM